MCPQYLKWPMLLLTCALASQPLAAQTPLRLFEALEARSQSDPNLVFLLSEAEASSASPVIITVPGRRLRNEDRGHRISLQKYWLSVNVPQSYEFRGRVLVKCDLKRENEFSACDRYTYNDPATGKEVEYYIYVGNWP